MERLLFEIQRPAELTSVRELRHQLSRITQSSVPYPLIRKQIQLCISEAATNLVEHAEPGIERIWVRFGRDNLGWWLEILDDGRPWDPTQQEPSDILSSFDLTEHNRGLALLRCQSDRMEYRPRSATDHNCLRLSWKAPQQQKRPRILLVEDNDSLRRLYAAYLSDSFEVETAVDGHDALQHLVADGIDLVLSDIRMPQMDGFSLREQLNRKQNTELIPFIFLTAADEINMLEKAARLGIDDYLIKPISKSELIYCIQRILGRSEQIYRQLTDRINKRISASLAPSIPQSSQGWRLRVAHRHTGIGGGDLLLHRSNTEHLMLALVDIMGHDDSAKFFSYAYGGYLRGLMHSDVAGDSPAQLLESLSDTALLDNLFSQLTLTCCVATLAPDGELTLASAGHPSPIKISAAGAESLPVGGIMPGILPSTRYQSLTLRLTPGERIAFYTDGLFESAPDEAGRRQLETSITKALVDSLSLSLDQALAKAMETFDRLAGTPPDDDTLLLLIEPTGSGPN